MDRQTQNIFDAAPDAIIVIDEQGVITNWNPRAEMLFGWKAEEVEGKSLGNVIIPPRYRDAHQRGLERYLRTGENNVLGQTIEIQALDKNGDELDVALSISPAVRNGQRYFIGFIRDISAQRRAQEEIKKLNATLEQRVSERTDELKKSIKELSESRSLLQAIVDNSPAVIYVKDLDGRYLLVNNRFLEVLSISATDVLGKMDLDILPPEAASAVRAMDRRVATVGHALKEEEFIPQKDGVHTYISVKSTIKDQSGRIKAVFGVSTDITELKTHEEILRKTLKEVSDYKFALDESSIVAITDQKGIIRYVNDNFCKISKYSAGELIGQDHRIINSGYHPAEYIRNLWVTIANGKIWRGELRNKARDGSIYWVDTTIVPFLDEKNKPYQYVAIRADITDRKAAEEALYKLNEELENRIRQRTKQLEVANREMEAFAYSVSHDLRAPLRGVVGFASILDEDYGSRLDEEARRITQVIKNSALKMGYLIDDLLAFSRTSRQDIVKTNIPMQSMVSGVIEELAAGTEEHSVEWTVKDLPLVKGDIGAIRQVWVNLISNALKYAGKRETTLIEIGSFSRDSQVTFYVKDNGVGFDNKYRDKLFKVFQRLHAADQFEGTGIGLALVEKIISKHSGTVWAEGVPDEGACFFFSLPAD
ncbi:MAG TPA: PAS domain S-box protein [Puia sp.]